MSFRDFKFPAVVADLGLVLRQGPLFTGVTPRPISAELRARLTSGLLLSQNLNNEKARSEFVVAPLLLEVWEMSGRQFGLHSGCTLDVDESKGLNGVCDFLLARDPLVFLVRAPILTIIEAKNDNVWNGFGQCIATMHAVDRMNCDAGTPRQVFGASTTGREWKFFRLDGADLTIDSVDYTLLAEVDVLAGILLSTVPAPAPTTSTTPQGNAS